MKTSRVVVLLAGLLAASTAVAEVAVGVKAGTLGAGLEATVGLSERTNLRIGGNTYSHDFDETNSGIRYDAELDLRSGALILDWHPFAGTFRMSVGAVYNKNEVTLRATPTTNQTIGGNTYTPAQIGTLNGDVKFKKGAPYVGVGWGNAVGKGSAFGFNLEIGAMYQGKPEVSLRGQSGTLSGDPTFEADVRREQQELEQDLEDFKVYPVISLGLSYRF